jgi:predicted nucleic acid-binding protein
MSVGETFVCDANALINFTRHFPKQTRALRKAITSGQVQIPEGVYRELVKGSDKLSRLLHQWKEKRQISLQLQDPRLMATWNRINQTYGLPFAVGTKRIPGFWSTVSGRHGVDAQVVAVAAFYGYTAVSDDTAMKSVCMLENVTCISWQEFARRIGVVPKQRHEQLTIGDE